MGSSPRERPSRYHLRVGVTCNPGGDSVFGIGGDAPL